MKTPSFLELKTLVEYLSEQLIAGQLQEVHATDDGIVLTIYRFQQMPRVQYLVFDLDRPFPFLGLFSEHPWGHQKKSKPVGLFLNAHAKNLLLKNIQLVEKFGRVVVFELGKDENQVKIEFRSIPKHANLMIESKNGKAKAKSISWYPVDPLLETDSAMTQSAEQDQRSIPFLMKQWFERRSLMSQNQKKSSTVQPQSPYEKWIKQKQKDISKKTNALSAIQKQIDLFQSEPWSEVGEYLKSYGIKSLPPEWSPYVKFDKSVSENMQACFEKAKSAKVKIKGAIERKLLVQTEIEKLQNLSEGKFEKEMKVLSDKKNKAPARVLEGKFRKLSLEDDHLVCYMGKSAQDNLDLLRKAKSWDYWLHLKDYPSAHAIIHRQKGQVVSDQLIIKCAKWLVKEGINEKKTQHGGKFGVVIAECRHVRPIKGDKLGRVTYNEAREFLIAL